MPSNRPIPVTLNLDDRSWRVFNHYDIITEEVEKHTKKVSAKQTRMNRERLHEKIAVQYFPEDMLVEDKARWEDYYVETIRVLDDCLATSPEDFEIEF